MEYTQGMTDLLQCLQQNGALSATEHKAIKKTCLELGENPVRILRSLNVISPEKIQDYFHKYLKILALSDDALEHFDSSYQDYIPMDIALFYSCFAIGEEEGALYVAMEDPTDRGLINQLRFLLDKRVVGVAATVYQLAQGLKSVYSLQVEELKLTTAIDRSRGVVGGTKSASLTKEEETLSRKEMVSLPEEPMAPLPVEFSYKSSIFITLSMTKMAFCKTQANAFEILNSAFLPVGVKFELSGQEGSFKISCSYFEISSSFADLEKPRHSFYLQILPLLKKIGKLPYGA